MGLPPFVLTVRFECSGQLPWGRATHSVDFRACSLSSVANSETLRDTLQEELCQLLIWVLLEAVTPAVLYQWSVNSLSRRWNHPVWLCLY